MTAVPILAVIFTFVIILNVLENSSKERNRKIEAALRMREMELGYQPTPPRSGRKSFPTRMLKKLSEKRMNSMPQKAAPGLRWSKGSSTLKSVSTIWKRFYGVERTPIIIRNEE